MNKILILLLLWIIVIFPKTTTVMAISSVSPSVPNYIKIREYRLTSFYMGDPYGSGKCTASGICIKDFKVNDKGWFTYKGKLVVATANRNYIKKSKYPYSNKIIYRNLYDEIEIIIDNITYKAIVLDICGYAHKEQRIDLFVSSKEYLKDTKVLVKEK